MEHFYTNIEGWFSYEHIYRTAVKTAKDDALFVEIGSFKGRSSAFMVVEIINSGKKIKFDCIDTWKGNIEHQAGGDCEVKEVIEGTLYQTFLNNMKPVEGYYHAIRLPSLEAVKQYEDNSIDFIMIDGEHSYEAVKADIEAWLPKMKNGGIMTGDDTFSQNVRRAAQECLGHYGVTFPGIHFYCTINKS